MDSNATNESAEQDNLSAVKQDSAENRNHVTPYAFGVSSELLGTPLATPLQRLVALIADFFLILLMTQLNDVFLAALFAWMFFKAANDLKAKGKYGVTRKLLRLAGGLCVIIVVLDVLSQDSTGPNVIETEISSDIVNQPATPHPAENNNSLEKVNEAEEGMRIPLVEEDSDLPPMAETDISATDKSIIDDQSEIFKPPKEKSQPSVLDWIAGTMADMGMHLGWAAFYFSVFTAWLDGQTPGKRLMNIKVVKLNGAAPNLWESFQRYGGYGAGLATGLMGFVQVYWDANRQAVQDKISETLVISTRK